MTGTTMGLNMKYLPWQLFVPIIFGLSMGCMYYAVTIKGKGKVATIFFFCCSISGFSLGIETLANHTGIFAQYLPIIEVIYWFFACILIILIFFFLR